MLKHYFAKIIIVAVGIVYAGVSFVRADFGAAGWQIFKKVHSSQFQAIASVASSNADLSGFLYNPSAPGLSQQRDLMLLTEIGTDNERYGGLLYKEPFVKGIISAGWLYYNAGKVELNWVENGEVTTDCVTAQNDMLGIVSLQYPLKDTLYGGVSLKGARSELAESESAAVVAADFGLSFLPTDTISVTMALQNVGKSTAYKEARVPLPTALYFGTGITRNRRKHFYISGAAAITATIEDNIIIPEVGFECGSKSISFNAGYRAVDEYNLHAGIRMLVEPYSIGYAFVPGLYLDHIHRITISFQFQNKIEQDSSQSKRKNSTKPHRVKLR